MTATIRTLTAPVPEACDALRALLQRGWTFPLLRTAFEQTGVTAEAVAADPFAALARLPVFDVRRMTALAEEALTRAPEVAGVELTSGTSGGPPKRRILTETDVVLDAALLVRLLALCGVRAGDRVAAVELTATPLAVAFLEACERLGARDPVALALGAGLSVAPLAQLAPDILLAPPSLLGRITAALLASASRPPRLIVYNGDRLADGTRAALTAAGVAVRSLYGLTETSALGAECGAGPPGAVHLLPEHVIAEVRSLAEGEELLVTPVAGFHMPLPRYPTGDLVRVIWTGNRCACGEAGPVIMVLGRIAGRFAMFDNKFDVEELAGRLPGGAAVFVLGDSRDGGETLTVRLDPAVRERGPHAAAAVRRALAAHPLMGYLLRSGLVRLHVDFQANVPGRKPIRLIDRRRGGEERAP